MTGTLDRQRWFVAQTHPRLEWIARMRISEQGFEVFLPTHETNRSVGRRMANLIEPLFPGYLFVSFDCANGSWRKINGTRGVSRVLCSNGRTDRLAENPLAVPVGFVEKLKERATMDGFIAEDSKQTIVYAAGTWLRVDGGVFSGHSGSCAEPWDGRDDRISILLHLLGRDMVVRVNREHVTACA